MFQLTKSILAVCGACLKQTALGVAIAPTSQFLRDPALLWALFGLSITTGVALGLLGSHTAGLLVIGVGAISAVTALQFSLTLEMFKAQAALEHHQQTYAAAHQLVPSKEIRVPSWPAADLDAFTATDLEELMTFAADVFEFLHQEYALFMCVFGESYVWGCVAGLGVLALHLTAVLSSRRFK